MSTFLNTNLLRSVAGSDRHESYLDGLRGLAILMVLAHHSVNIVNSPFESQKFSYYMDCGSSGVTLFFIISAYTLLKSWNFRVSRETSPALKFYVRRAFRILPFWWLNMAYRLYLSPHPPLQVLTGATMTFGFFATTNSWSIVPYGWSLCVEETFYWFFPVWVKLIKTIPGALYVLFLFVVASLIWTEYGHYLIGDVENHEF